MKISALLIFLFLAAGYAWSSAVVVPQERSSTGLSAAELARAKTLFRAKCARCHGVDGRGQTPAGKIVEAPDFTSPAWWKLHNDEGGRRDAIKNGDGDMPAFGKKLTEAEISLLAKSLRRFQR